MPSDWLQLSGAGAAGANGTGGSPVSQAPNITSATAVISFAFTGGGPQSVIFSGVITLPTSDPHYADLNHIDVIGTDPNGNTYTLASVVGPWGGSTTPWSNVNGAQIPQPATNQTWASIQFVCYDPNGLAATSPYTITSGLTVSAPGHPIAGGAALTVTNTQGSAPTISNIFMGLNGANNPYWQLALNLATAGNSDPNTFYYAIWVEWVSAASGGVAINPGGVGNTSGWTANAQVPNDGAAHPLLITGNYPAAGVDGYFQITVYALNRVAAPVFTPTASAPYSSDANIVLQTTTPNAFHIGPPPAINSSNMLANPSFNQPSLVGWQTAPSSGTSYAAFSTGGVNYAQVSTTGNFADIFQNFDVRELDGYVFELWVALTSGSATGVVEIGTNFLNASNSIIGTAATVITGLTSTVAPFSVSGAAPLHTVSMQVTFAVGNGMTATFLLTNGYLAPATGAGHARNGNVVSFNPGPGVIIRPDNLVVTANDGSGNVILNPGFETGDTQGWHPGTGATLGVTSSTVLTGGFAGVLLPAGATLGQGDMIQGSPTNYAAPVAPGSQWFAAFDVNCAAGGGSIDLWLECFGLSGFVSSVVTPAVSAPTSGWQHVQCVLTIPTGTGITEFVAVMRVTGWTANDWIIDNVVVRPALSTDSSTLTFNSQGQASVPLDGATITVNPDGTVGAVTVPGGNMVANPGAENGVAWWSNPSSNPFISTNTQHAPGPGSRSFSLTSVTVGSSNLVSPGLTAVSGQIFTASCAMLGGAGNLTDLALNINFFDPSGSLLSSNTIAVQTSFVPTSWTTLAAGTGVSISQIAAPANTAYVELNVTVIVLSGSTGNIYIDNIELFQCTNTALLGDNVVTANNMAANAVTLANGAIAANAVVDSNIVAVNIGKLIAGTVIFTGTVFLSQGSANPILELSNTSITLFGAAASGGGSGLTTQPYVTIQNTGTAGILVYGGNAVGGGTGPSVVITGASTIFYSVNGSATDQFVEVAPAQITIQSATLTSGAFSGYCLQTLVSSSGIILQLINTSTSVVKTQMTLSPSTLTMAYAGTTYLTLSSTGIAISNGSIALTLNNATTTLGNITVGGLGVAGLSCISTTSGAAAYVLTGGFACENGAGTVIATCSILSGNAILSASNGSTQITLLATSSTTTLVMSNLPSSNPGAGSKQFWYDTSDSNRVKFAA